MRARASLVSLGALLAFGCSLTGLSDFPVFECATHEDCEPLNQRRGITDPCVRYQCAADSLCRLQPLDRDRDGHASAACAGAIGCDTLLPCDDCDDASAAAHPGLVEVCDGVDNDCNLVVDDGVEATSAPTTVARPNGAIDWHSYGVPLPGSLAVPIAFASGGATFFHLAERDGVTPQPLGALAANVTELATLDMQAGCPSDRIRVPTPTGPVGPGTGPGTCLDHDECADGVLCNGLERCDPSSPVADARGCVTDAEPPCGVSEQCNERLGVCERGALSVTSSCPVGQLATAELGDGAWFAVAVQPTGCGGLVRVGYFTENPGDLQRDPGRNVLYRGDHRRSTSFRGIDPVFVGGMGSCTGRSRESGALGASSPAVAALPTEPAAGRRRPQALAAWVSPEARLEVIGLWDEQFLAAGNEIHWVSASGDAIPQPLGPPTLPARPALASWVGDRSAGYLLAWGVPGGGVALRFVPAFDDPPEVQDVPPRYNTPIGLDAVESRTSAPLAELGHETRIETDGEAAHVQLSVGRVQGDHATLALAWRDASGVRVALVELDAVADAFSARPAERVADGAADELTLGYAPSGFVLPGYRRGDRVAATDTSGGWLLAWKAGRVVRGVRVLELDGASLDATPMQLGVDLHRLHSYVRRGLDAVGDVRPEPGLLHQETASGDLQAIVFCGPPA